LNVCDSAAIDACLTISRYFLGPDANRLQQTVRAKWCGVPRAFNPPNASRP